jgi:hypothetical protein
MRALFGRRVWLGAILLVGSATCGAWGQPSQAYVFDGRNRDLYRVDVLTGDRAIVSGARWKQPLSLVSETAGTALVLDGQSGILDRVDPGSHSVSTVSGPGVGTGPDLAGTDLLTPLDASSCVVAEPTGEIVRISLTTGERQTVSAVGLGDGPSRRRILSMTALDESHLLVSQITFSRSTSDPWRDGLYAVDLSTGDWIPRAFADPISEEIDSVDFNDPREILVGLDGAITLLESVTPAITLVSPSGEFLTNVALILESEGTPLILPVAAVTQKDGTFLVLDRELQGIYRVSLPTGARTLVSRMGERGTGPSLDHPEDMAAAPMPGAVWVLTGRTTQSLVEVDLTTGNRQEIFETRLGEGPLFEVAPNDLLALRTGELVALVNGGRNLGSVDPATGDRALLMDFEPPLYRIAPGLGRTLWGARGHELMKIDLAALALTPFFDVTGVPFADRIITGIDHVSPHHLILSMESGLFEMDPLAASPDLTQIFTPPTSESRDYEWLRAVDQDLFVFLNLGYDQYSPPHRTHPGLYSYTRGDLDVAAVSNQQTGGGVPMPEPRQFNLDELQDIYVVNALTFPALLRVNLSTGTRTEVSGPHRGGGPLWETATSVALADGVATRPIFEELLDHLLGITVLTGQDFNEADADNSGTLDVADLVQILGP